MSDRFVVRTTSFVVSMVILVWSDLILPATIGLTVSASRTANRGLTIVGAALTGLALLLAIRIALTRLVVTPQGITHRGALWQRSWRWEDIEDFEIFRDPLLGFASIAMVRISQRSPEHLGLVRLGRRGRERLQETIAGLRAELRAH